MSELPVLPTRTATTIPPSQCGLDVLEERLSFLRRWPAPGQ